MQMSLSLRFRRPGSSSSEVTRYGKDMLSLLAKCTLGNFGVVRACIHSRQLAVDSMISSVGRVYTLYTASISIISTAGTA